jgi:two-component system chemotaxis response regulator CheY
MSYRILIVDDSAATRALIASALESDPELEITETASGFEALRALPQGKFDLILTDINMPDINGLELVRFIKTSPHYRDKPLIIISSVEGGADRKRGMALGASEYVVKPFDPDALLALCRSYLGRQSGS